MYNRLLLKLIELRTLHEMHSSILLDADPAQLEPFPLALIMNEKEEARHFKVDEEGGEETETTATALDENGEQEVEERPRTMSETGGQSSASESESPTPVNHHVSMPPTPLTASAMSASNHKHDHYANMSILTPASSGSSGSFSMAGQISSVSSPALESPFMADTPQNANSMPPSAPHHISNDDHDD